MFAWSAAEATVWPIIPDFLLVPMAVGNRRRFYLSLGSAVLGAAIGGALIYAFGLVAPHAALEFVRHMPFVREAQIASVDNELRKQGVTALFRQPWSGVSFKVWGVVAGAQGLSPALVIPAFVAARAVRMAVFAKLASAVSGGRIRSFMRDYSLFLLGAYLVLFFFGWWQVVS